MGVEATAGETPSLTGEFVGETHRGLEHTQTHPLRKQHQKGPIWLWAVGWGSDWKSAESRASAIAPSQPLPHISITVQLHITLPWWIPKAPPLYVTGGLRQKKLAQMKEQIKAPQKIQVSNEQIANLSDVQFKTLVIRKLTELVEFSHKLDEKMKAMLRETKESVQGTNSGGMETGTQINGVDQKEERNF